MLNAQNSNPINWQGIIRPFKPQRAGKPDWQKTAQLGVSATDNAQYWTWLKLTIRGASFQYPNIGVFLQLSNGKGSCFVRIDRTELNTLIDSLVEWRGEIEALMPTLEANAKLVEDGRRKYDEIQQAAQLIQRYNQEPDTLGGDEEPDDTDLQPPPEVVQPKTRRTRR